MSKISVIVPCYQNEGNVPITTAHLLRNEATFGADVVFEYVFVDDGSTDGTIQRLKDFRKQLPERVTIIKLAHNVGSYNAIYAGLAHAQGDCYVVISADLQDPPELINQMYVSWKQGFELVVANRLDDSGLRGARIWASLYHLLIRTTALPDLPSGGFDFCLFDKNLRNRLLENKERDTNSLYLLFKLKRNFLTIPYQRRKREIGTSQWTLQKKLKLVLDTVFSLSTRPFKVVLWTTLILILTSGSLGVGYFAVKVLQGPQSKCAVFNILGSVICFAALIFAATVLALQLRRRFWIWNGKPPYIVEEMY
jgi:glycosyltransferase involved in cell wall biosynthesis